MIMQFIEMVHIRSTVDSGEETASLVWDFLNLKSLFDSQVGMLGRGVQLDIRVWSSGHR